LRTPSTAGEEYQPTAVTSWTLAQLDRMAVIVIDFCRPTPGPCCRPGGSLGQRFYRKMAPRLSRQHLVQKSPHPARELPNRITIRPGVERAATNGVGPATDLADKFVDKRVQVLDLFL
jgi:hypothetical protein